jgi:hypothetical protein
MTDKAPMTATTKRPGAAAALPLLLTRLRAAVHLCSIGAEPHKALAVILHECDPELATVIREAWDIATDPSGSGLDAVIVSLAGLANLADMLRSIGVEPVDVLQLVNLRPRLAAMVREAWAVADSSGVARDAWSFGGPGSAAPAVNDALSRLLTIADRLRSIGVEPREVIHVLQRAKLPPQLVAVARAAWTFAAGLDDGSDGEH